LKRKQKLCSKSLEQSVSSKKLQKNHFLQSIFSFNFEIGVNWGFLRNFVKNFWKE
jgi:hypothetical protein